MTQTWLGLVKEVSSGNKGKPLSYSLKQASKIWKQMKKNGGKTGKKIKGGDDAVVTEPADQAAVVPVAEPAAAAAATEKTAEPVQVEVPVAAETEKAAVGGKSKRRKTKKSRKSRKSRK